LKKIKEYKITKNGHGSEARDEPAPATLSLIDDRAGRVGPYPQLGNGGGVIGEIDVVAGGGVFIIGPPTIKILCLPST
jgi:hypothetical protein